MGHSETEIFGLGPAALTAKHKPQGRVLANDKSMSQEHLERWVIEASHQCGIRPTDIFRCRTATQP